MYREVTMVEVKEVLRLWCAGVPRKRLAAQLGLDPKTVRRYLAAATAASVRPAGATVTELQFGQTATTIPVLDGPPGQELQVDTGWVGWLTLPVGGLLAVSRVDLYRSQQMSCRRAESASK